MEKREKILFLEGGEGTDYGEHWEGFLRRGYELEILQNLYEKPEQLSRIPEINPDYLFIGTTGMFPEKAEKAVEVFQSLNYIPNGVIFVGESSVMAYLDIARELKKYGTKFYYPPMMIYGIEVFEDDELEEINWI